MLISIQVILEQRFRLLKPMQRMFRGRMLLVLPLVLPLVVYDLLDQDCAALASNGELSIANSGSALY